LRSDETGGPILFETASNLAGTLTAVKGDADAAFRTAPYTRREHFKVQRHTALPMEPRGLVAEWQNGRLDPVRRRQGAVSQSPHPGATARLPDDAIRMVENDVGGGFGVRGEFYPEDFLIRSRRDLSAVR